MFAHLGDKEKFSTGGHRKGREGREGKFTSIIQVYGGPNNGWSTRPFAIFNPAKRYTLDMRHIQHQGETLSVPLFPGISVSPGIT